MLTNTNSYQLMPISKDDFETIDEDESPMLDLSPDTTQGTIYRFLLANADAAFRQREIVEAVDVPQGSIGPTLSRLEEHGLVVHRGRYWAISDTEHAVASAGLISATTANEIDEGFSDEDLETWMKAAVEPITDQDRE